MVKDVKDLHVDRRRILLNTPHIKEASGAIANFKTDVPANLKKCVVEIDPVQDLHGYEYPWPPGGGKNLIPFPYYMMNQTVKGMTLSVASDQKITITGTAESGEANIVFVDRMSLKAGTYTISRKGTHTGNLRLYVYDQTNSTVLTVLETEQTTKTFTIESDLDYVRIYYNKTASNINTMNYSEYLQLESGSSETAFAPYSNICPISGRTEMEVMKGGKNIYDNSTYEIFNLSKDGIALRYGHSFSSGVYTIFNADNVTIFYRRVSKDLSDLGITIPILPNSSVTVSVPEDKMLWVFNTKTDMGNVCVSIGTEATEYEPYNATTIPITFPSEAGTVYGGTLDLLSGELVVDMAMVDLGSLNWNKGSGSTNVIRFYTTTISQLVKRYAVTELPNFVCSIFVAETENKEYAGIIKNAITVNPIGTLSVYSPIGYEDLDATAFQAAMSGVQLVYELATPTTYQLTAQTLKSLRGVNNIWSDAGDTTVKYWGH